MIEFAIINLFLYNRIYYHKYYSYIKYLGIDKELKDILYLVDKYYSEFNDKESISFEDFSAYVKLNLPNRTNPEKYTSLLNGIHTTSISPELSEQMMRQWLAKDEAAAIVDALAPVMLGEKKDVDLEKILEKYRNLNERIDKDDESLSWLSMDEIDPAINNERGYDWHLHCLTSALGRIGTGGNLGHLFARPDTGKTTFIIHLLAAIARQAVQRKLEPNTLAAIWINNEEDKRKLNRRFRVALLEAPEEKIFANPERAAAAFIERGANCIGFRDAAVVRIKDIRALVQKYKPRLVIIDQGDKVKSPTGDDASQTDKLTAVYAALREICKEEDVDILTVGQAGADAENKMFLQMDHCNNSKTGKPGEMDYMIGIGKTDASEMRYIHLCKNKLGKGEHMKQPVMIDTQRAKYVEM